MELNLVKMQDNAFENFIESKEAHTYKAQLHQEHSGIFKINSKQHIFEENKIKHAETFQLKDRCKSFADLARKCTLV